METTSPTLERKRDRLLALMSGWESVAVALSGGVDSAVVAQAARLALGDRAVAVTADSPSVARADLADACRLASSIGIQHTVINTHEFSRAQYRKNDGDRCYHCKTELYDVMQMLLPELDCQVIVSGANLDDLGDYRPGLTAAAEHSVRHPLQEAEFSKDEVRQLAQAWGLPVWDKPASPCLASRLVPGLEVTPERTQRVELAEVLLKSHGINDCRVRHHEHDLARLELDPADFARFVTEPLRTDLVAALENLGFRFVTLDLKGFRSGNLNQLVSLELRKRYTPHEESH